MNSGHSLNDAQILSSNCWLIPAELLHPLGVWEEFPPGLSCLGGLETSCGTERDTSQGGPGREKRAQL